MRQAMIYVRASCRFTMLLILLNSHSLDGEISSTTMLINSDVNDTGSSTLSPDHSTLDEISASQADFLSCMPMELFDEIKSEILTSNNRQGDTAAAIKPNANHARLSKIELPIRSKRNVSTISDASDKRGASVKLNATKGYSKQVKISMHASNKPRKPLIYLVKPLS